MVLSPVQRNFLTAPDARVNLLSGGVRAGKTYVSLIKWAQLAKSLPHNAELLMAGKTLSTLERNCLHTLSQIAGSHFQYSLSKKGGTLYGRRVYFEGAGDERAEHKIRGMTLSAAYCDELTLFPRGFYRMLLSRLSRPGARLYATTNPDAPTHWVFEDIVDNPQLDRQMFHFIPSDNPTLDAGFQKAIACEYTGMYAERFLHGRWVRAEGAVYPMFADNPLRYVQKHAPEALRAVTVGVDFGGVKSRTAFVAIGITLHAKRAIVLKESVRDAMLERPETLEVAFVAFLRAVKDEYPQCVEAYCDSAEPVLIRGLWMAVRRAGLSVNVRNARKGSIKDRIRLVNALMGADRFALMPDCPEVKKSLTQAVWDDRAPGDVRLDDGSYAVDPLDAMEYALEPHMRVLQMGG